MATPLPLAGLAIGRWDTFRLWSSHRALVASPAVHRTNTGKIQNRPNHREAGVRVLELFATLLHLITTVPLRLKCSHTQVQSLEKHRCDFPFRRSFDIRARLVVNRPVQSGILVCPTNWTFSVTSGGVPASRHRLHTTVNAVVYIEVLAGF